MLNSQSQAGLNLGISTTIFDESHISSISVLKKPKHRMHESCGIFVNMNNDLIKLK